MTMTPVTIPAEAGQPALEGVWLGEGERIAVVAPPHPLMGGELSNPVVQALAMGLGAAGTRSLLFNWRGVGESHGQSSGDPEDAERDYLAALDLAARAGAEVVAAGYSFGAATAIRVGARDARVRSVLAVAPRRTLRRRCGRARLFRARRRARRAHRGNPGLLRGAPGHRSLLRPSARKIERDCA
jgi:alpha/beta superfamily hydrolase